jgi:hypothetical protein
LRTRRWTRWQAEAFVDKLLRKDSFAHFRTRTKSIHAPQFPRFADARPRHRADGLRHRRSCLQRFVKADGTNLRRFITPPAFDQPSGLAWSPDGSKIAFTAHVDTVFAILVANADGSNQHALTTSGANFGGAWSPDGQQLEFTVMRNNNNQIARMNADGSEARLITKSGTNAFPAWKPAL